MQALLSECYVIFTFSMRKINHNKKNVYVKKINMFGKS